MLTLDHTVIADPREVGDVMKWRFSVPDRFVSQVQNKLIAIILTLAFFVATMVPQPVSALTFLGDGGNYHIGSSGDETEFAAFLFATGTGGSWSATFDSSPVETTALADAMIGDFVAGTFTNLSMSWVSLANGMLDTVAVTPGLTTLSTFFSSPGKLVQRLTLSWTASMAGAGFSVEVGVPGGFITTPLPAPALLFLSALAGFVFLGWRRKFDS